MNAPREAEATTEYEIFVRGELGEDMASDLGARRRDSRQGTTLILVDVVDQAQLHGVIERLRDLNVEIERVSRL